MDSNNWRPTQPDPQLPIDGGDWRSQLQPESRQRIVNKIMETLKRHLPFSGQEGLQELKQIAIRFEEKIYSAATSQSDYLRKISLKMLTMESKSQSTLPGAMPSNTAGVSRNPQDSVASQTMQSQVHNQSQSVPLQMVPNQSQTRQQLISQNMQNNIASGGMQTAVTLPNTLPPNGLAQNSLPSVPQNSNLQNVSGISQSSMGNTMNQGIASNMFSNAQRQMQARQLAQQVGSQQQPQQTPNQNYLYQQQLQQQILKQKLQQGNIQQPLMQTPLQQQQQPQAQQNLMQAAQQPMMQTSSVMQPSMVAGLQQNQQSSIQQPSQSVLQQHQQSVLRQQQQPPPQQTPVIQQQQPQLPQQSMMSSQQQQQQPQPQLMGQQPHTANIQHNQLLGQQSNISDMQQQQQRMIGQQNNVQSLQPQQQNSHQNMQQQQHVMAQQNSLQNLHQQQVGHQSHVGGLPQQQQLIGTQSNNGNMQTNQHSVQMIQQSKVPIQQQTQNGTSILPGGGQQSQSQQQLSQLHSQPTQMQQQIGMQQQQPPPPNSLQHNMQQRMQNVNPLIQQQSLIDPQKQLYQSQRTAPEAPTTSLDSTAQTSSTNGVDWQEEVYQKIKAMKDMYFADLNEMYQKISLKLQQHDSLPQPPKIDQIDKLRVFKHMLERPIQVLQTTKNNILPAHRDKLQSFERQIVGLLNSNRLRKPAPSMQQGQVQSIQQLHSQNPQAQPHDGGVNPQMQPMNLQGQVATMQPISVPSSQNGTVTSLAAISSSQQTIPSSLQSSSAMDSGQVSAPSSMQQVPNSTMQQNPASASQQANITSLQPQIAGGLLQSNMNHLQSSNMLQNQHLKQQEQQMMQSQLLKQQSQSRMQQQFLQKQQLFQHHQQMQQQAKQQMASQMQSHQMPQLNQITDVNEKMRQMRSSAFPPHLSSTQRFANQQLKPGASFPVSSPQLLQAVSPQINQHSSPQIDQQNLPPSVSKGGTPLHSANSPFVPSPSTPLVPSPMPGDNEKPAVSSLSNVANVGHQQSSGAPQSLNIGTPGISPSPLFEIAVPDGTHGNTSTVVSGKSSVTEQPIERLLRAVRSISPEALNAAVSDISSVVSMVDRIAGSAPGNGSRATVGEDLVAMTKCRLQARNFLTQDGSSGTKRMRRYTSAMPLNVGDMNENLKKLNGPGTPELESTATSRSKKARIEVNHALLEEIREINERLIDTVVEISDEDTDPSVTAPVAEGGEGTIVSCSFSAITLSPILRAQYTAAQMSPIQPLKLLVPPNYPNCSPVLLDKLPVGTSNEHEDLSVKAKSKFSISLRCLSQPMSLKDIARTWDDCARGVLSEYAQQKAGGTFSSKYGAWENCLSAA